MVKLIIVNQKRKEKREGVREGGGGMGCLREELWSDQHSEGWPVVK